MMVEGTCRNDLVLVKLEAANRREAGFQQEALMSLHESPTSDATDLQMSPIAPPKRKAKSRRTFDSCSVATGQVAIAVAGRLSVAHVFCGFIPPPRS